MAVVNTPGLSEQNTENGFFSIIRNIGQVGETIGTVVRNVSPLWSERGATPQPKPPQPTSTNGGSNIQGGNPTSWMPIVIVGAVLVGAIFLLKK